jgi:hypothetical protein
VAAAGVAALVLGTAVGLRLGQPAAPLEDTDDPLLVAGAVERLPDEYGFQIRLLNATTDDLRVGLVYDGRRPPGTGPVTSGQSTTIPPATWRAVPLHVPGDCRSLEPTRVHALVRRPGGRPEALLLPLPPRTSVLRELIATRCRDHPPPGRTALVGLWVVAEGYAFQTQHPDLWRFDRDGTFVADSNGRLFVEDPGLAGTYRIEGRHLLLRVTGGYRAACLTGPAIDVDTARMPGNRLLFSFPDSPPPGGAGCALPTGVDWVLQRLAGPRGLPD